MHKADREQFVDIKDGYSEAMQQHETVLIKCAEKQKHMTLSFILRKKDIKQLIVPTITCK